MIQEMQTRIGIVGTGYVAKGVLTCLEHEPTLRASKILTRSDISTRSDFPWSDRLTNSIAELIDQADLLLECSGDPIYGTDVLSQAVEAGLPVVTMNSELQVTTGSYFARRGLITEAEGDQPGCIAALREDVVGMGFTPLVYGNLKGYLNLTPTREDMRYWARRNGFTLPMVTAFTDGTKLQFEQALVANGFGADIAKPGMLGYVATEIMEGGHKLAAQAAALGRPISDYLLCASPPAPRLSSGVFITAEHDPRLHEALAVYKLGKGPYYTLERPFHLAFFEILKTVRRVVNGGGVLLNNGDRPTISVAAVAKEKIVAGTSIPQAIGSFALRGSTVRIAENPTHIPMGLVKNTVITSTIEPGQHLTFADVEIPDSLALAAWRETLALTLEDPTYAALS